MKQKLQSKRTRKDTFLGLLIDPQTKTKLQEIADREDVSLAHIARKILRQHLSTEERAA